MKPTGLLACVLILPLAGALAQCSDPPPGLVAWWSGDGHSFDLVGANQGTNVGGVSFAPGKVGLGFTFATTDDWVRLPGNPAILAQTVGTVEFWARILSLEEDTVRLFSVSEAGVAYPDSDQWAIDYRNVGIAPGAIQVSLAGIAGGSGPAGIIVNVLTPAGTIADTNWHHIAVVADGVDPIEVYVDGTTQAITGFFGSTNDRFFGHAPNVNAMAIGSIAREAAFAEGVKQIDELGIYDRPLSAGEVAAIHAAGSAGKCKPAVRAPAGVAAWWSGDGHSFDLVGANHGASLNSVGFAPGQVGRALSFDGVSSYLPVTNTAAMDFGAGDFTIEGWLYFNSLAGDQEILHKVVGLVPDCRTYFLEFSVPNSLRFMVYEGAGNNNDLVVPASLVVDQWCHVAAVRSGNTNLLFLNGSLIGSQVSGNNVNTGQGGLARMGNMAPNGVSGVTRFFDGMIDELSLYDRALTTNEIAAIHAAGSAGKHKPPFPAPAGLVSWWPAETNALDLVGPNHGVPQGAVAYEPGKVGQAFSFNGANTWLVMPPVFTNAATFSFEGWLKVRRFTNPDYTPILCQPCDSQSPSCIPGEYWFFAGNENSYGSFRFTAVWHDGTQADVHSIIPFGTGTWEHVAVTYDGASARTYWNGQLYSQTSYSQKRLGNPTPFWVGRAFVPHSNGIHENAYLDGLIDELSVYSRALSAEEIAAIHAAGSAGKMKPPTLQIVRAGEQVRLFWPADATGYGLVSRTDLVTDAWTPVTNTPGVNGSWKEILLPTASSGERFFRLQTGN